MSRCPRCKEPVSPDVEFCPVCSYELIDQLPKMMRWTALVCVISILALIIVIRFFF